MTAQLQIDLAPGRLLPLVRCVDCGVDLGEHALGNLCVPCQKVWRVKRIRITPDWSAKQMRAGATAPQAGSRSGVSSADHAPSSPNANSAAGIGCEQGLVHPLRVLVACEYSGTVRDAFAARGHDAMSCDLLPTDRPGKHYQGDVRDVLDDGWDLMIAHPPCTSQWSPKIIGNNTCAIPKNIGV